MTIDHILVALTIAGAVAYLALRFRTKAKSKGSCGDSCGCGTKKAVPPQV